MTLAVLKPFLIVLAFRLLVLSYSPERGVGFGLEPRGALQPPRERVPGGPSGSGARRLRVDPPGGHLDRHDRGDDPRLPRRAAGR